MSEFVCNFAIRKRLFKLPFVHASRETHEGGDRKVVFLLYLIDSENVKVHSIIIAFYLHFYAIAVINIVIYLEIGIRVILTFFFPDKGGFIDEVVGLPGVFQF